MARIFAQSAAVPIGQLVPTQPKVRAMRHVIRLLASLGPVAAGAFFAQAAFAQSAPAQTAPATPPTYKALMDQGYELKTAVYLSDSASTRLANAVQPETVIVTLQKGPLTASCWIALSDWQAQDIGAFPCTVLH
jgi:hypothetical protein